MADVVNLNLARKAKERLATRVKAEENTVKFGLTKAEKARLAAIAAKDRRALDGAKKE